MRVPLLALVVALTTVSATRAQTYSPPSPEPATTSRPTMHAQALMRATIERFHRGLAASDAHDWNRASEEFQAALALNPPEPQGSTAAYDLGLAQSRLEHYDDAAQSFRTAITRDPGFLAAMSNLVAVDLERKDVREARDVANRFVALAPDSARAHYSRGISALASNDFLTARDDFSQLLKNDPRYAVAHYDLGIAETHLNRYDDAAAEFSAALQLSPGYARARFALGTVLLHQGNRTAARDAFDRAARDAADDPSLRGLAVAMRDAITITHE